MRSTLNACLCGPLWRPRQLLAQAPVGTISGTVHDQTNAVLPGASITVRHAATGAERHVTSADDGTFAVPSLPAGAYTVTAELSGFRNHSSEVTVATGRVATLDLRMEVGAATEAITVSANAIHVETEAHAVSGVIARQKFRSCPSTAAVSCSSPFSSPASARPRVQHRRTTRSSRCRSSAAIPTRPRSPSTAATSVTRSKATPG